jgi:hypothetical protein
MMRWIFDCRALSGAIAVACFALAAIPANAPAGRRAWSGELQSVQYSGVTGGNISLPCTQRSYCTGKNAVLDNTSLFSAIGAVIGPHSGVILLKSH